MQRKTSHEVRAWKHAKRVAWRKVSGEAVILDVETAVYYSLADAGLRMWELIGDRTPADEVGRVLAEEFDAPAEAIQRDFEELARALRRERLIEPA